MSHHTDAPAGDAKPINIAFGLERLGLWALRVPLLAALLFAALAVGAGFGVSRISVDDSLSQLFRSDDPEFKQFEAVTQRFPSNEYDVLVVVEGKTLLERDNLDKLRSLVTDLQLVDGTRGIISLFSARAAPENGQIPAPLFPETLPEGDAYKALIDKIRGNDIIRGKLISDDGTLALVVLSLDPAVTQSTRLDGIVGDIRKLMGEDLAGSDLHGELSGVPVMQLEIRNAVERDRLLYNTIGFVAGCLVAILFFRRVSFMVVAAGPPLVAILFALGCLGWLDFKLNMFLNVMTPLIMVISFSDSMQLTFAARDRLIAGESKAQAFRNAIIVVGPACVLTHATAALSFTALMFTKSELIRTFGEAGLISTVIALVTVLTLAPVLGVLLVRGDMTRIGDAKGSDTGVQALRRFCAWIAHGMVARPGLYSLVGIAVVAVLAFFYANLEPSYRLADQVPDKEQAVQASGKLDNKLNGANPVDVYIQFPAGADLYSPETLGVIDQVHDTVEAQGGIGNVWSLDTLQRWLSQKLGKDDVATLKQYVDLLPAHLTQRFVAKDHEAVLVSGRVPDHDSSRLLPIVDKLDAALNPIRAAHPGYKIAVTGLAVIAARNSSTMIEKLNHGLTFEFLLVAAFIGLAFRSVIVFLASILPGIFPVVLSGAVLWWTGGGLQFISVVALTVSFGLGLSATIHFLNRLRHEDDEHYDADPAVAVERATVLMGPALILTSAVLACGLAVTVFSDLPSLRTFGWLSAFAMMAALVADFLILRPTISWLRLHLRRPAPPAGMALQSRAAE
ncbi:MMPL family transporter [Lichenihabitans sp. Uapishka_5]|uniref:efflux RND transporter permease subunit n=1 Tax=Lichenihabitans sp. Uapishka_5 TaxID=3037302 RepID=UPI0029E7EC2B|nr:MMPL family transporter [Lichenihabitans sp. Uapishka_5]MDX7953320.1 MMPL family transporter [Lichenihabitans sp. Uapishka_5]